MAEFTRRGFLTAAGTTVAGAWIAADALHILDAGKHAAQSVSALRRDIAPPLLFLTPAEAADIDAATSQIIPTDDTPGAHEAGVVYFVDKSLTTYATEMRAPIKAGIAELHARADKSGATQAGTLRRNVPRAAKFASLSDDQQHEIIASLERDKHAFFFLLRGATVTGMFANPEYGGNAGKAGWKLIGFDDRFSWAPPFEWYDANE